MPYVRNWIHKLQPDSCPMIKCLEPNLLRTLKLIIILRYSRTSSNTFVSLTFFCFRNNHLMPFWLSRVAVCLFVCLSDCHCYFPQKCRLFIVNFLQISSALIKRMNHVLPRNCFNSAVTQLWQIIWFACLCCFHDQFTWMLYLITSLGVFI